MKKRIVSWYVAVEWSDNPKNEVVDIPDWVATNVDKYLNKLEDEVHDKWSRPPDFFVG